MYTSECVAVVASLLDFIAGSKYSCALDTTEWVNEYLKRNGQGHGLRLLPICQISVTLVKLRATLLNVWRGGCQFIPLSFVQMQRPTSNMCSKFCTFSNIPSPSVTTFTTNNYNNNLIHKFDKKQNKTRFLNATLLGSRGRSIAPAMSCHW